MLMTLSKLRLIIDDLKKDYNTRLYNIQGGATISKVKELNGNEEILSPPFDFKTELSAIDETSKEVARLSGILAKANNTTPISESDTLQTALAKIQERRKLLDKIEYIISASKEAKIRKTDGGLGSNSAFYEITELNFNKNELIAFKDDLKNEINYLELKIQEANNSTNVEV